MNALPSELKVHSRVEPSGTRTYNRSCVVPAISLLLSSGRRTTHRHFAFRNRQVKLFSQIQGTSAIQAASRGPVSPLHSSPCMNHISGGGIRTGDVRIRPDTAYAWCGPAVLITNCRGECSDDLTLTGFYFRETRYLATLRLEIDGDLPWLCEIATPEPDRI